MRSNSRSTRKVSSILVALVAVVTVQLPGQARAQLTTYFESSGSEQKPRSNAGLAIQSDRIDLRADVAVRAALTSKPDIEGWVSSSTEVVPNLRSAISLAKNLDLETRVSFAEWNAGENATVDTRLHYRRHLDVFFDELDGSFWRSPDGLTKQILRLGFNRLLGDPVSTPLRVSGAAIFEATQSAIAAAANAPDDSRKVGIETRVTGLLAPLLSADHALVFKVEKSIGAHAVRASTLAYDQSWTLNELTNLGFNLKVRNDMLVDDVEPSIYFNWRSQF